MAEYDRRQFVRYAALGALIASAGGASGCARLLEWSDSRRSAAVRREFGAEPTATAEASAAVEPSAAPARAVDLGVLRGDDPAANTEQALELLGGMARFVRRGDAVVIKPNILMAREPEYAATTNPIVVATLVRLAWEAGAKSVTVFDRPTAPPRQAYEVSGIAKAVDAVDGRMKVLTDRDFENIEIPEGESITEWPFVTDVFEADTFINVPIAKTHSLTGLTLSMKNLMGVMGSTRGKMHQGFDQKIVDVNSLIKPQLTVLDATRLLVRNGPSGGSLADVRPGRTIVAGTNQVAVDSYGATLFDRAPESIEYLKLAEQSGLGTTDLDSLVIEERRA